MEGGRSRGMFVIMLLIMFVLFLSLIHIVFDLTGGCFIFEFLLLLLFLSAGIIFTAGIYSSGKWVWPGLLVFFGANLINLIFLFWKNTGFSDIILPLTAGVIGFLTAMIKKGSNEDEEEYTGGAAEAEEKKPAEKEEVIRTNFSPGKYIASETGKKYHIPKCDWAKKINKKRIIWLDDKEEAKKKGYMPCKCVK